MLSGCTGPDYHGNLNSTDSRDAGKIKGQGGPTRVKGHLLP